MVLIDFDEQKHVGKILLALVDENINRFEQEGFEIIQNGNDYLKVEKHQVGSISFICFCSEFDFFL
jgi:hypothetical protein